MRLKIWRLKVATETPGREFRDFVENDDSSKIIKKSETEECKSIDVCSIKNLPISSSSYENNKLKVSNLNTFYLLR